MISRLVLGACLVVVMLVAGPATYLYLGSKTSRVTTPPTKPTAATPRAQAFSLPGTIYIAQDGALYSLAAGRFHQLTPEQGWMQPSLAPDGNLLAVKRDRFYSDVYVLSPFGNVIRRVTNNVKPTRFSDISANHWSFYPRLSADGKTLWMAYDRPKYGYDVVLSIWAMPASGTISQGKLWTDAADYAGGDVQPIPVRGGIIYTHYDYGPDLKLVGRLWFTSRAYSAGRPLTDPSEDCRNPSVSPDGTQVAMICTHEKQLSYLTIASWNGSSLGPRTTLISDQMVAQPVWAPDGSGIAYLAPSVGSGPFQLWFLPRAAYAPVPTPAPTPTPGGPHNGPLPSPTPQPAVVVKPIQVTTNNGFDATSPIAWRG
jgi:WD40-like Beta Propeller Repeat